VKNEKRKESNGIVLYRCPNCGNVVQLISIKQIRDIGIIWECVMCGIEMTIA